MVEAHVHGTIGALDAVAWNACFPGAIEDHAYLAAVEDAGLDGFTLRYLTVARDGAIIAAAPLFLMDYAIETTLTGAGHRIAAKVRRLFPRLLTPRLACIGSPCTETATIGFVTELGSAERREAASALIAAFEALAAAEGCALLGFRDVADEARPLWDGLLGARGYHAVTGMPSAWLPVDFTTVEEYLAALSSGTRRNMRRKLKAAGAVRIEHRTAIDDVIGEVMALYTATRDRAEQTFETLTASYFTGVLAHMPGRAFCTLYWGEGALLAINLLIEEDGQLLDKFFCMDGERGRALNLYFLSWFANIERCLARGLVRYHAGQAAYASKLKLGCRLAGTTMFVRHRNPLCNYALRLAKPLLAAA